MKHIYNRNKSAIGVCLIISQLFTLQGAWAKSMAQDTLDNSSEARSVYVQKKQSGKYPKFMLFDQPSGGEAQISASAGYSAVNADFNTSYQSSVYKIKSQIAGATSEISAAYGFTDNFYSKMTLSYSNSKNTQSTTAVGSSVANPDSISTSDGIKEPSVLLGAQTRLGATQIFAELSVDVAIGDKVDKRISSTETSDNNLRGGMSYSPHLGLVQDLGSILVMGGASYTFKDDRNERFDGIGYTNINKVKGGNATNVITGLELKNLSRWGFVLGYYKEDSSDSISQQTNQVSTRQGYSRVLAASYLGIKIGSASYLIPKLTYETVLDKTMGSNGVQTNINQIDGWEFNVGARVNF